MVNTELVDNPDAHRFQLQSGQEVVGFLDYSLADGVITMVHIEVDPAHSSQGHAETLTRSALDDARSRGLTVVPSCPYVAKYIDKNPEYADLVEPSRD